MIRSIYILIVTGIVALTCSCGNGKPNNAKPIATVNDYVIREDDFRQELSRYASFHNIAELSVEDKQRILDELIRKELFINDAIKEGLDKDPEFRRTIERYWEQTLISSLIKRQLAGADNSIVVTKEEVEECCKQLASKSGDDQASIETLRQQLQKELREEKKAKLLEQWSQELWNKANIKVYKENLIDLR